MANEQDLAALDGITSAGLIADASGNLYGTTDSGGADGDGSVFELVRDPTSPTGYSSTPTTLVSFDGPGNGSGPLGGLIADASGNSRISFQDYAVALVDEIEQPQHRGQRFTIGY